MYDYYDGKKWSCKTRWILQLKDEEDFYKLLLFFELTKKETRYVNEHKVHRMWISLGSITWWISINVKELYIDLEYDIDLKYDYALDRIENSCIEILNSLDITDYTFLVRKF